MIKRAVHTGQSFSFRCQADLKKPAYGAFSLFMKQFFC